MTLRTLVNLDRVPFWPKSQMADPDPWDIPSPPAFSNPGSAPRILTLDFLLVVLFLAALVAIAIASTCGVRW